MPFYSILRYTILHCIILYYIILYTKGCPRLSFLNLRVGYVGFAWRALGHCCPLLMHAGLGLPQPCRIPGNHGINGRNLTLTLVAAPCLPEACQLLFETCLGKVGLSTFWLSICYRFGYRFLVAHNNKTVTGFLHVARC